MRLLLTHPGNGRSMPLRKEIVVLCAEIIVIRMLFIRREKDFDEFYKRRKTMFKISVLRILTRDPVLFNPRVRDRFSLRA
jgi:hypothetical protein